MKAIHQLFAHLPLQVLQLLRRLTLIQFNIVQKPSEISPFQMYPIKPPITGSNNNAIETPGENQRKTAFIPVCPSNPGPSDK